MPAESSATGSASRGHTAGSRAVVIGASMAGLCAAAALAENYERVTVVDADHLPKEPSSRGGVPQGRQIHLLLPARMQAMEKLLPGIGDELAAAGAESITTARSRLTLGGYRLASSPSEQSIVGASRPLIEGRIRARVAALPAVEIRDGIQVLHPLYEDSAERRARQAGGSPRGRVTGVVVRRRPGSAPDEEVPADLVVDCSGRRSTTPTWLAARGYEEPPEERLDVDLRYATRRYRLPGGRLNGSGHLLIGPTRDTARGGVLGIWIPRQFAPCSRAPRVTSGR